MSEAKVLEWYERQDMKPLLLLMGEGGYHFIGEFNIRLAHQLPVKAVAGQGQACRQLWIKPYNAEDWNSHGKWLVEQDRYRKQQNNRPEWHNYTIINFNSDRNSQFTVFI